MTVKQEGPEIWLVCRARLTLHNLNFMLFKRLDPLVWITDGITVTVADQYCVKFTSQPVCNGCATRVYMSKTIYSCL